MRAFGPDAIERRRFLEHWVVEILREDVGAASIVDEASSNIVRPCIHGHHQVVSRLVLREFLTTQFPMYRPSDDTIDRMRVGAAQLSLHRSDLHAYYRLGDTLLNIELLAAFTAPPNSISISAN